MKKLLLIFLLCLVCQNSYALSLAYDFAQNGSYESSYALNINQIINIDIYALNAGSTPDGLVGMGFRLEFDNTHLELLSATLNSANWDIAGITNTGTNFVAMAGSSFNAFSGNVLLGQVQFKTLNLGTSVLNLFDFDKGGSVADFVTENNAELDSTMTFPYAATLDIPTPTPLAFLLVGFAGLLRKLTR